jgi:glycosyltransferase involved in cell wall biosynthesis
MENRKEIKISVIMPVYNAEKYLRPCLDCYVNQTFKGFELIFVDDGSTDSTAAILDEYRQGDARVVIITNRENVGQALSRNIGLRAAKGDYLYFADGDDLVELDMLEAALAEMIRSDADIVEFSCDSFTNTNYSPATAIPGFTSSKACDDGSVPLRDRPSCAAFNLWGGTWNKLYSRKFILDNQLEFQNLPHTNDFYFTFMAFLISDKRIQMDSAKAYYHWRLHDSVGRISNNGKDPFPLWQAMVKLQKEVIQRGLWPSLCHHCYIMMLLVMHMTLVNRRHEETAAEFYDFLQKEGVPEIYERGGMTYDKLEPYTRTRFQAFTSQPYNSFWWEGDSPFNIRLENSAVWADIMEKSKSGHPPRLGIWGAGGRGKSVLHSCEIHGIPIDAFIDIDESKQGSNIKGIPVKNTAEGCQNLDMIIVSNSAFFAEVEALVADTYGHIELIDIYLTGESIWKQ